MTKEGAVFAPQFGTFALSVHMAGSSLSVCVLSDYCVESALESVVVVLLYYSCIARRPPTAYMDSLLGSEPFRLGE